MPYVSLVLSLSHKNKPPAMVHLFPFSEVFMNCRDYPIEGYTEYHEMKTVYIPPSKHWTQNYSYYGLIFKEYGIETLG